MANIKYFENGYLTLSGDMIMKLTDISMSYTVDTDEVTSYDSSYSKEFEPTYTSWTASANGIVASTASTPSKFSGESRISGNTTGIDLLETIKNRQIAQLVMKVDSSNYQVGNVILNQYDLSGSIGSKMTYSLSFQGTGDLTKYAS